MARVNDEKSLVKRDDGMVVANIHTGSCMSLTQSVLRRPLRPRSRKVITVCVFSLRSRLPSKSKLERIGAEFGSDPSEESERRPKGDRHGIRK